jgi:hypothetical protein
VEAFSVIGASGVQCKGKSQVARDIAVSPGHVTQGAPRGPQGPVKIHMGDAVANQAHADLVRAYGRIEGIAAQYDFTGTDMGRLGALVPAVYQSLGDASLTGDVYLDARGDPDAMWVFRVTGTLRTAASAAVHVLNDPNPCPATHIAWQVGGEALLRTGTTFVGNLLALDTIYLNPKVDLDGRAMSLAGSVSLDNCAVGICAPPDAKAAVAGRGQLSVTGAEGVRVVDFQILPGEDGPLGELLLADPARGLSLEGKVLEARRVSRDMVRLTGVARDGTGTFSCIVSGSRMGLEYEGNGIVDDVPLSPLANGFLTLLP